MPKTLRNSELYTSASDAKHNILVFLAENSTTLHSKSRIGFAAFPNYCFRWPQGAAFAVAKIVRELENNKLVVAKIRSIGGYLGYTITEKGKSQVLQSE